MSSVWQVWRQHLMQAKAARARAAAAREQREREEAAALLREQQEAQAEAARRLEEEAAAEAERRAQEETSAVLPVTSGRTTPLGAQLRGGASIVAASEDPAIDASTLGTSQSSTKQPRPSAWRARNEQRGAGPKQGAATSGGESQVFDMLGGLVERLAALEEQGQQQQPQAFSSPGGDEHQLEEPLQEGPTATEQAILALTQRLAELERLQAEAERTRGEGESHNEHAKNFSSRDTGVTGRLHAFVPTWVARRVPGLLSSTSQRHGAQAADPPAEDAAQAPADTSSCSAPPHSDDGEQPPPAQPPQPACVGKALEEEEPWRGTGGSCEPVKVFVEEPPGIESREEEKLLALEDAPPTTMRPTSTNCSPKALLALPSSSEPAPEPQVATEKVESTRRPGNEEEELAQQQQQGLISSSGCHAAGGRREGDSSRLPPRSPLALQHSCEEVQQVSDRGRSPLDIPQPPPDWEAPEVGTVEPREGLEGASKSVTSVHRHKWLNPALGTLSPRASRELGEAQPSTHGRWTPTPDLISGSQPGLRGAVALRSKWEDPTLGTVPVPHLQEKPTPARHRPWVAEPSLMGRSAAGLPAAAAADLCSRV